MSDLNSLEVLFPQGRELSIRDTTLVIKPFKFGQLSKVFKIAEPLLATLFAAAQSPNQVEMITKVLADGGDNVVDLLVLATGKDRAWVDDLEMDEGVELFSALLEVNSDFFVKKVLPLVNEKLSKVVPTVGQTQ